MTTRPVLIALPGFTRGPANLERLAHASNAAGLDCVRPTLAPRWLPALYMSRTHLRRMAARLSTAAGGRPVVVSGHSAGAAAGCFLAVELRALGTDVRGAVLIDGVDSPTHLIARYLPELAGRRVAAVLAPASPCNRQGALGRYLESLPWVRVETVPGAGHGDIEGAGIGVYRRACRDTSDPATADLFLASVVSACTWAVDADRGAW